MRTVQIVVIGKVQGVFFRKFAVSAAVKSGVRGFVRNASDGSVVIEASGEDVAIDKMIAWCHEGSPYGRVDKVHVTDLAYHEYDDFSVKY